MYDQSASPFKPLSSFLNLKKEIRENQGGVELLSSNGSPQNFIEELSSLFNRGKIPLLAPPRELGHPIWESYGKNLSALEASIKPLLKEYPHEEFIGFFSSGSTGLPKLILHKSSSLVQSAYCSLELISKTLKKDSPLKILSALPFHHMGGFLNIVRHLSSEHSLVFSQPAEYLKDYEEHKPDVVIGVPLQLHQILKNGKHLPKLFYSGGEHLKDQWIEKASKKNIRILSTYGLTESCGALLYKLDLEAGAKAYPDVKISIHPEGYLTYQTDRQAMAVLTSPTAPLQTFSSSSYMVTNDLAYEDAQGIFIKGRRDDIFVCAGENISPKELEVRLQSLIKDYALPISHITVKGMPHDKLGHAPVVFTLCENSKDTLTLEKFLGIIPKHFSGPERPRFVASFPSASGLKPSYQEFLAIYEGKEGELFDLRTFNKGRKDES